MSSPDSVQGVPLLDLRRHGAEVDAELEAAFRRVLHSGHYILGPEVEALERECAAYLGVKHALGVSSGSDALILALMALGVGPGDEVICPTYTFYATAGAIWRLGARPVFVDCSPRCYNAPPDATVRAITPRTKAIIPVHLFGQCAEIGPVLAAARERGIPVIEDAAQAIGARDREGRGAGTMGAIGCFSFFPSKNLGAFGDAGLVTTHDDALAESMRVLRAHGGKPKYHHAVVGGNFRIDALQAALLRVKLPRLDGYTAVRQRNAARYTEQLVAAGVAEAPSGCGGACGLTDHRSEKPLVLPTACQSRHIFNQYVIRVRDRATRDGLLAHLKAQHVGAEVYYPVPMHQQTCFASLGHKTGDFPNAEAAAAETLAIPIFPELTPAEIDYVVRALVAFLRA